MPRDVAGRFSGPNPQTPPIGQSDPQSSTPRCSEPGDHGAAEHDAASVVVLEEVPLANLAAQGSPNPPEPYVDAAVVARHLAIERRQVLHLTREKKLPGHPIDPEAKRKTWRYKLSEVDCAIPAAAPHAPAATAGNGLGAGQNSGDNAQGSSRSQRRKNSNG